MVRCLFDFGLTHSFLTNQFTKVFRWTSLKEEYEYWISTTLGKVTRSGNVQKEVNLKIEGHIMAMDLVWIPMEDFDLILGMDWLVKHDTTI